MYSLEATNQTFRGITVIVLQANDYFPAVKNGPGFLSETRMPKCRITYHHASQDHNLNVHHHKNVTPIFLTTFTAYSVFQATHLR